MSHSRGKKQKKAARHSPKAVHELSQDTQVMFDALNNEPALPCVLLSTSFLEHTLATLILSRLIDGEASNRLFDPTRGGPLGTIGARISLALCLGLIAPKMERNLRRVARVRNQLAHTYTGHDFDSPGIREDCLQLELPTPGPVIRLTPSAKTEPLPRDTPRERFTFVTLMMVQRMLLTALAPARPVLPAPGKEWHDPV